MVVEIVSDRRGEEEGSKFNLYIGQRVPYYVIFDPRDVLGNGVLRAFVLTGTTYTPIAPGWLPGIGLGLRLWDGAYEGHVRSWLRWCDQQGQVILTGAERAEEARQRAEDESRRAKEAQEKVERLAARLRALGVDPEV